MNKDNTKKKISSSGVVASVIGIFGGFLGFEHGIGEILHGNVEVKPGVILAWEPGLPFPFGVEPAMTIVPNYLVTGILAVLMGLIVMVWSGWFIRRKYAGIVLYILAIPLLLFGGGFAPIWVLLFAGIAAFKIKSEFKVWKKLSAGLRNILGAAWPWLLIIVFLWSAATVIFGQLNGMNNPGLKYDAHVGPAMASGFIQLGMILLTVIAAMAHDSLRGKAESKI
jgi:hypothetical protein